MAMPAVCLSPSEARRTFESLNDKGSFSKTAIAVESPSGKFAVRTTLVSRWERRRLANCGLSVTLCTHIHVFPVGGAGKAERSWLTFRVDGGRAVTHFTVDARFSELTGSELTRVTRGAVLQVRSDLRQAMKFFRHCTFRTFGINQTPIVGPPLLD
jgi:hypothetical protein